MEELKGQLILLKNLENLPKNLTITTISFTFDLPTTFLINNISEYFELKSGKITTIKYMVDGLTNIRTMFPDKYATKLDKKNKKKAKKKDNENKKLIKKNEDNNKSNGNKNSQKNSAGNQKYNFDNQKKTPTKAPTNRKNFGEQATVIFDKCEHNSYPNDTNIKLFSNGAIQFSGCLGYSHFYSSILLLFEEIVKDRYIWDGTKFNKISFCTNKDLSISTIQSFKINLVNTGFHLGFNIHRDNLFELLVSKKVNCSYEPSFYPGIQIIYEYGDKSFGKDISIVVFEKGYVMINGGIYMKQIMEAYKYVNDIIYNNYSSIVQWTLTDFIRTKNKEISRSTEVK